MTNVSWDMKYKADAQIAEAVSIRFDDPASGTVGSRTKALLSHFSCMQGSASGFTTVHQLVCKLH